MKLTKVNAINTKLLKAFFTRLFTILTRAVDSEALAASGQPKFGSKKDLVSLPAAFEPLAQ